MVYWPARRCEFLNFDDGYYFTDNPYVKAGLTWDGVLWAFTTGHAANWHPLTWLSLMVDAELFGTGSAGPHLTNLLFHAANAALLFLLLHQLKLAAWRSALVAAFFALHPLLVESVAWVSERKDVLSTFFGLLSLLAYAQYEEKSAAQGSKSNGHYSLALLFFALGLMAKPMLVTLPFVLLLLDWWPLKRVSQTRPQIPQIARLAMEKAPFFALSVISCVVTFLVQQQGEAIATLSRFPFAERVGNAFVSYARYLGKTFWPAVLANPYPHPEHWPLWEILLAALLFFTLCFLAVGWRRRFPFVFVGWFWFVGMLVPVIGLVQVGEAALADRYTYLPLIGVFLIVVCGVGEAGARWPQTGIWFGVGAAVVLTACAWRTRVQLGYWQNSGTLFHHALAVTEDNYVACNNLGTWLTRHKVFREAVDCFRESLRIEPNDPDALYNLGNACARLDRWDEAIDCYRRARQFTPDRTDLLDNLGLALVARGQYAEAVTNFETALKLNPNSATAHNNLATVLFMEHHFDEAARQFREALRLLPNDPQITANLGDALVKLGQASEAARCYQESLRLKPGDAAVEAKLRSLGAETPK